MNVCASVVEVSLSSPISPLSIVCPYLTLTMSIVRWAQPADTKEIGDFLQDTEQARKHRPVQFRSDVAI